jgi:hypothetical protein
VGDDQRDTQRQALYYVMRIDRLQDNEVNAYFNLIERRDGFALMQLKGSDLPEIINQNN